MFFVKCPDTLEEMFHENVTIKNQNNNNQKMVLKIMTWTRKQIRSIQTLTAEPTEDPNISFQVLTPSSSALKSNFMTAH